MEIVDWETHQWLFEPDGSLLDIYVQNIGILEWIKLIKFLNQNHVLEFYQGDEDCYKSSIDQNYVVNKLTGKIDSGAVAYIFLDNIQLNCHFFILNEIEFDLRPETILNEGDFLKLAKFLNSICKLLDKHIILTPENKPKAPCAFFNQYDQYIIYSEKNYAKRFGRGNLSLYQRFTINFALLLFRLHSNIKIKWINNLLTSYIANRSGANKLHSASHTIESPFKVYHSE